MTRPLSGSKSILSATLFLVFSACFLLLSSARANVITVDFSKSKGPMRPLNGLLLVPNYDVPDGRVIPLRPRVFRDDSNFQAWYIFVRDQPYEHFTEYEYSRLATFKNAYQRVTRWGAQLYPIFITAPSWISPNKRSSAAYPTDLALWKQWARDNVEFAKSQGMKVPFWDSWNEFNGLNSSQYQTLYSEAWNAIKEVDPSALLGGPSSPYDNINAFTSLANHCLDQGQTLDIAAWHNFSRDTNQVKDEVQTISKYRELHPALGIQQLWVEEYHPEEDAFHLTKELNWLSSLEDCGVDVAIKSTWHNADSMSDLLTCGSDAANNCVRNPIWWLFKAYGEMSGTRVDVVQGGNGNTAIACYDLRTGEAKVLVSGVDQTPVDLTLNLNSQPFGGSFTRIDKYKITSTENDGLVLQSTENPRASKDLTTHLSIGPGEVWLVVLKKTNSAPGSFMPMTPDDGMPASTTPTLTWTPASGATDYSLQVSKNPDMSLPVVNASRLTSTNYPVAIPLEEGIYYWKVTARNAYGATPAGSNVIYSFQACANENVPAGRFSLQVPVDGEVGTPLDSIIAWTTSYGATSYRLQLATDGAFSNLVMDQTGTFTMVHGASGFTALNARPNPPLSPSTTYYARVFALNANGSRIMNGPVHRFTTTTDGAPAAFSLQYPAGGSFGVTRTTQLKWSVSDGSFYKLEVSTAPNFTTPILSRDDITTNSYTVEPDLLAPNTLYYWRVTGYPRDRTSSTPATNNGLSFRTDNRPCAPLLLATQAKATAVTLFFRPVMGATGYKIEYGKSRGQHTTIQPNVETSPCEVTGLQSGAPYYFVVVATNAGGDSLASNERSETPLPDTDADQPAESHP